MPYQIEEKVWNPKKRRHYTKCLKPIIPNKPMALRAIKHLRRLNPEHGYEVMEA